MCIADVTVISDPAAAAICAGVGVVTFLVFVLWASAHDARRRVQALEDAAGRLLDAARNDGGGTWTPSADFAAWTAVVWGRWRTPRDRQAGDDRPAAHRLARLFPNTPFDGEN